MQHPSPVAPRTPTPDVELSSQADDLRRQLETIADNATLALFIMDEQQHCTYMNPAAERLTGYRLAEVKGKALHDYVHHTRPDGSHYPLEECPIDQAFPQNMREQGEEVFVHRDRHFYPVAFTASPIRHGERTVGTIIEVRDITEEKREREERERLVRELEEQAAELEATTEELHHQAMAAEEARRAAEAASRAKSEFLAVMSHELRTPLNAIGGYAELIDLGIHGPVTPEQRGALARIQHSQRHLLGLINGVLNYSRIEAGAVTYDLADVPVAEAVAEAEALIAPQLRARGLAYVWLGCPPSLAVRADREKLQQVLLNLLSNAVKFTSGRGGAPGRVDVSCTAEEGEAGGWALLRVRDTGEGIGADKLKSIFEPIVQVDQQLTRPHEGVGLGLAISRDLARGMGGDLTVESTPGAGSTFTLRLPLAPAAG